MVRETDNKDDTDNHDDHFFAVDEFSPECVTHETKRELTDDVADVGSCVDGATKKKWVGGTLLALETAPVSTMIRTVSQRHSL